MPIYSYVCKDCGEKFDLLVGVTAEREELKCKKCGSNNITNEVTGFNIAKTSSSGSDSICPADTCPMRAKCQTR